MVPGRLKALPSAALKRAIPPCSCLILTVMPVSVGVCTVCLSHSLHSDHRVERISPSARLHGERASLLSSKGSSDKKRVKAPESFSPEGKDFTSFVHFPLCFLSFFFFLFILSHFCSRFLCVSLSSWLRENPILPGVL